MRYKSLIMKKKNDENLIILKLLFLYIRIFDG